MAESKFIRPGFPPGIVPESCVFIHCEAQKELRQYFEQNPRSTAILLAHYQKRLEYLAANLGHETFHPQWFEVLKNESTLRSMRFNRVMYLDNLRIIYCIDNGSAYLLAAFKETGKAKARQYTLAISLAEKRFQDILR